MSKINLFFVFTSVIFPSFLLAEKKTFPIEKFEKLKMESGSGKVEIGVTKDKEILVEWVLKGDNKDCPVIIEAEGKSLIVKQSSPQKSFLDFLLSDGNNQCQVDFNIMLPEKFDVNLDSGSGSVSIVGVKGQYEIDSGSGSINIDSEISTLKLDSGSGSVNINGLIGDASIDSGSGAIRIGYTKSLVSGKLNFDSGSGSVTITLPKETKVNFSDIDTGSGRVMSDFTSDTNAKFIIKGNSGSGSVYIKAN